MNAGRDHKGSTHTAMRRRLQPCLEQLLKCGRGDWLDATDIVCVAKFDGGAATDREIQDLSLELRSWNGNG
jgi:hypothetical protein